MAPRNVAGSVVRGADFWGRERDVEEVWRRLHRGDVLLTNPRRFGKSSLMAALADAQPAGWTVVYLDVYPVETVQEFVVELGTAILAKSALLRTLGAVREAPARIARWFASVIDEVGAGVPEVAEVRFKVRESLPAEGDWRELAASLLDQVARKDGQILIIIDEFPSMIATLLDSDRASALSLLKWMRSRRGPGGPERLRFLLGGSVNVEPLLESIGEQRLINDLDRYHLEPFSTAIAETFVNEVLTGEGFPKQDDLARRITEVADTGVPFFLQVLISACITDARLRAIPIEQVDVEAVFEQQVLGPTERYRFSHYLTRLRESYGDEEGAARFVLATVADQGDLTAVKLRDRIRSRGISVRDLDALLNRLVADYYLEIDNGKIRFTSGFLRRWWRRNAPRGR